MKYNEYVELERVKKSFKDNPYNNGRKMSEFSKLVDAVSSNHHLTNNDGSFKLDSLGRRIHVNQSAGRPSQQMNNYVMVRMTDEMHGELAATAKKRRTTMSKLVRDYIEWGMENDE